MDDGSPVRHHPKSAPKFQQDGMESDGQVFHRPSTAIPAAEGQGRKPKASHPRF